MRFGRFLKFERFGVSVCRCWCFDQASKKKKFERFLTFVMYDTILKKESTNKRVMILLGEFPFFIIVAILIPIIKLAIYLFDEKINGKKYAKYVEEISGELINNDKFIESLVKVVVKHNNIDDARDDIEYLPLLEKYAMEIDEKAMKNYDKNPSWKTWRTTLAANAPRKAQVFADTFIKEWKNTSTQNQMVQNVKSHLKR